MEGTGAIIGPRKRPPGRAISDWCLANGESMSKQCWMRLVAAAGVACAVVTVAAGCRNPHPKADAKLAAELSTLVYPGEAPLGADLDVLVIREVR